MIMLSGQIKIEGEIHKRTLGALGRILRSDSVERRLAERHILVKDGNQKVAWGTLLVLAVLQVLANKLYKTYREKIFNTW